MTTTLKNLVALFAILVTFTLSTYLTVREIADRTTLIREQI